MIFKYAAYIAQKNYFYTSEKTDGEKRKKEKKKNENNYGK